MKTRIEIKGSNNEVRDVLILSLTDSVISSKLTLLDPNRSFLLIKSTIKI